MSIILDTPEQINAYRVLSIRSGLRMEIQTGMKVSRGVSCMKVAQMDGLTEKRTKMGALKDVDKYVVDNLGLESVFDAEGNLMRPGRR